MSPSTQLLEINCQLSLLPAPGVCMPSCSRMPMMALSLDLLNSFPFSPRCSSHSLLTTVKWAITDCTACRRLCCPLWLQPLPPAHYPSSGKSSLYRHYGLGTSKDPQESLLERGPLLTTLALSSVSVHPLQCLTYS